MKVSVVGTGYVGLSLATLISRKYEVVAVDIIQSKVDMINERRSPIADAEIERCFAENQLNLAATTDISKCAGSDYVIVATPTNYDADTQMFDTSSVEAVIGQITSFMPDAAIIIKSTIPIGYTEHLCGEKHLKNLYFSPEFLREGKALYDNLHPSRIIVGVPGGSDPSIGQRFGELLRECSDEPDTEIFVIGATEAESVKLFSNTYLAMRVAYFNELDSFAEQHGLNSKDIIIGVCKDPRIGNHYNNPSFGYGGYCLPKDTKQLLSNYRDVPNSLIGAIVKSNDIRKRFIADEVAKLAGPAPKTVGVYRLAMKSGSDNFRESSIMDVMGDLSDMGYRIIIFEPLLDPKKVSWNTETDLGTFIKSSDIIIANRMSKDLAGCSDKVYCRDLFNRD